jgi:threonine/homoserine/homoserine lactone efflux protein
LDTLSFLPDARALALFVAAGLLLNFTPGPDMLYVLGNSVGRGRRAGVVSALGIGGGTLVHTLAAALGLSALLASSPLAYDVLRYAGAAYLIYLGVRTLLSRGTALTAAAKTGAVPLFALFRQGVLTNVLNPKVALFFLAFLPQFVDPSRGGVVWQFAFLGTCFNTTGTLVNSGVALVAGTLGEWASGRPGVSRVQRWFTGSVFLALGARVAAVGRG